MKAIKKYNIYIFISTFIRNIIDVYSVIYLYKLGFTIQDIIATYAITYFLGYFISYFSLVIGNKIGHKYILIISSITSSLTFYAINNKCNIYLIAILLSLSMFTYHPIRHYYGIKILKNKNKVANTLIYTYIAVLLSSYIATTNINIIDLFIISTIGIIPTLFIKEAYHNEKRHIKKINKYKMIFFFFDQFRILFMLLEPLYLYIVLDNIVDVGVFNAVLTLASIICVYVLANKIDIYKKYKYINLALIIILLLKLNVSNRSLLFIIAFFEGIGIKTNEFVSTINLYDNKEKNIDYILKSEQIFCIVKALLLSIIYFLSFSLKTYLYLLLLGIFILSFVYKKDTLT